MNASLSAEFASYNSREVQGMVNIPMGENYALRVAGNWLTRDGYTDNIDTGNDIDDRDLWSARATFAFQPTEWLDGWLLYETFREDDSRSAGARSLCIADPGPSQVGDTAVSPLARPFLSQGCAQGSIYSSSAFAYPNSVGTFGGRFAHFLTLLAGNPLDPNRPPQVLPFTGDLYAGQTQPRDLRDVSFYRDPSLDVEHDIIEMELNFALTDQLTLSLLGHSTGRLVLDWMPETSFSDSTLVYASYSRGYKSGGFNSPEQGVSFPPYEPEFVNAYEIGTKNVFHGGRTQLNASLFYYDYQDYQISKVEGFSARNENIDATIWGLELETSFEPIDRLRLSANVGWLKTEIESGESVDPLNRTAGVPGYMVLRNYQQGCIAPVAAVEGLVQTMNAVPAATAYLFDICAPDGQLGDLPDGFAQDLSGNELPNAPELSASLVLQYGWSMADWDSRFLIDYSWKDDSYASVFNGENYELRSWENANASLMFSNVDLGLDVQLFVKNIFDDDTIVNYATGSDGVGLVRNISLLDPRIYGLNVGYHF